MATIRQRGNSHQVLWRDERGKQCGKSFKNEREAEMFRRDQDMAGYINRKREAEGDSRRIGVKRLHDRAVSAPRPVTAQGGLTIAGVMDSWLANKPLSGAARRFYRMALNNYIVPAFPGAMSEVTTKDVKAFLRGLEAQGKSGAVVGKVRAVGSSLWTDCIEDEVGDVEVNPFHGQKIRPHAAKAYTILTRDEFERLLDSFDQRYRLVIETLGNTGLRWSECMRLTPADIEGQYVHVRHGKSRAATRKVKVRPELAEELRRSLPFKNSQGKPIDYVSFRRWYWVPATEGTGWRIHDLRHSFCSWGLQGGATLVQMRDVMGHSNISITSRYSHTLPDAGDDVMNAVASTLGRAS